MAAEGGKDTKYGTVTTSGKIIPTDEPVFLLRAQDILAPAVVRYYAALRASIGDHEAAKEIMRIADSMERWSRRKYPD